MDTLNPILNALVQDMVRQLTPVVVQAIAGELENYKLQTDQKIADALDVNRNWVRGVVGEVLDQDLRGRVADVLESTNDEHIIDVDAMAARVIDNLDMDDLAEKVMHDADLSDLAERVVAEINLDDLAEKVGEELDIQSELKEYFDNNSFTIHPQ
jgi:predicted regulator of amino acid metabolism with ACT domain